LRRHALAALKLLNLPISVPAGWHAFAGGIVALAQQVLLRDFFSK